MRDYKDPEGYREFLSKQSLGENSESVELRFVELDDDVVVQMIRSTGHEDLPIVLVNNKLLSDRSYRKQAQERMDAFDKGICEYMEDAGFDTISTILMYFAISCEYGWINRTATVSEPVRLSDWRIQEPDARSGWVGVGLKIRDRRREKGVL